MEADFDPEDKYSWYFGPLSRTETNEILNDKREGVFLLRVSSSVQGGYVLCVKEAKVSHYIINKVQVSGVIRFKIGDKEFENIPSLLKYYRAHYLDTHTLLKPAPRTKLVGKFDFSGKDREDLHFHKGDELELISRDEEDWWTARDQHGRVGQIPASYVTPKDNHPPEATAPLDNQPPETTAPLDEDRSKRCNVQSQSVMERKLPAFARVTLDRTPSAYDKTQLKLKMGEIIKVLVINMDGQWDGEVNGRKGKFPFTHVEFLGDDEQPPT